MDQPQAMVDGRVAVRPGQGGRHLEVGDRRRVVAEQRQHLAERLVEKGDVRIAERKRGLEMVARLPVGENGSRVLTGQTMRDRPLRRIGRPGPRDRR